jgi:hypothetical protein
VDELAHCEGGSGKWEVGSGKAGRQAGRQAGGQAGRQAGRQAGDARPSRLRRASICCKLADNAHADGVAF